MASAPAAGARCHTVIMLVSLYVLSELVLAMPVEVNSLSCDDGAWAKIV
jgi:hypothetical protein